ncbi:MAG: Smr/MutS family protein [Thermoanaerobaculia bacterium]|nr:Smr/MutS family protein [Thermoanaerobaculia bacterium]
MADEEDEDDDDFAAPEAIELEITDVLDLHSFPPRDVPELVRAYLDEAAARGFVHLRLIHGKGVGVQREIVRKLLAADPRVESFRDATDGSGWGATVVVLRPARQPPG